MRYDLPKDRGNEPGIICSVWLNPGVITEDKLMDCVAIIRKTFLAFERK